MAASFGRVAAVIADVPVWVPIGLLIVGFGLLAPAIVGEDMARAAPFGN